MPTNLIKILRYQILRLLVKRRQKRVDKQIADLKEGQLFVYKIAKKMISFSDSILESDPYTDVFYIKKESKFVKFDMGSIHLVDGKYSYFFSYEYILMRELKSVFDRNKKKRIDNMVGEISTETTNNLKKIYSDLKD